MIEIHNDNDLLDPSMCAMPFGRLHRRSPLHLSSHGIITGSARFAIDMPARKEETAIVHVLGVWDGFTRDGRTGVWIGLLALTEGRRLIRYLACIALHCIALDWIGLDWIGLDWIRWMTLIQSISRQALPITDWIGLDRIRQLHSNPWLNWIWPTTNPIQ